MISNMFDPLVFILGVSFSFLAIFILFFSFVYLDKISRPKNEKSNDK